MKWKFDPLLWIIYGGVMISYQNESFSSSFLSTHMSNYFGIQETLMGVIFAVNNIGQLVSNVFIGFLLKRRWLKRKTLINIGFIAQIFSCLMFISIELVHRGSENSGVVLAISLISRVINGLGIGVTLTIFFAYIPLYYPDEVEEKISGMEISGGVGLCIGPLVAGYLYPVDYSAPFVYSIVCTGSMIPVIFFYLNEKKISIRNKRGLLDQHVASILDLDKQPVIVGHIVGANQVKENALHEHAKHEEKTDKQPEKQPERQDIQKDANSFYSDDDGGINRGENNLIQNVHIEAEAEEDEEEDHETDPRFTSIFDSIRYLQIFMPFLMITLANGLCFFLDPTLAEFMLNKYDEGSEYSGIIISLKDLVYIVACPCCTLLQKKLSNQRLIVYGAGILIGVSMFLFGPNHLFTGLPSSQYVSIAASILNGASSVFVFLPSIQIMIDNLESIYGEAIDDEQVGNVSSMLFNSAFSVGGFIGPMLAGVLVEAFGGSHHGESGFQKASATYGFVMIGFAILYIILGKEPTKPESEIGSPYNNSTDGNSLQDSEENLKQKLTESN